MISGQPRCAVPGAPDYNSRGDDGRLGGPEHYATHANYERGGVITRQKICCNENEADRMARMFGEKPAPMPGGNDGAAFRRRL